MNWDLLSLLDQLSSLNNIDYSSEAIEKALEQDELDASGERPIIRSIGNLIRLSRNPGIGLTVGRLINPNSFHGLGYLFMTADSLLLACQRICEFADFYYHIVQFTVEQSQTQMVLTVNNQAKDPLTQAVINEAALSIIYQYSNWLSQKVIAEYSVELQHSPLIEPKKYQTLFHQLPDFNAQNNQLCLPMSVASAPLVTSQPEYHAALYQKLKHKHDGMSQSLIGRVKSTIKELMIKGSLNRKTVAKQLHVSEKTLERRLSEHNLSYRELIDRIRLELAKKYLSDDAYPIEEIASKLGYGDRSAFSKAFKKWTGLSPREQQSQSTNRAI